MSNEQQQQQQQQIEDGNVLERPRNLNELLKLSIKYHETEKEPESNAQPMDPEKRKFFEEALKHVTINEFEQMQQAVKKLASQDTSDEDKEEALESITFYAENLDLARDLQTIGGFNVVLDHLKHESSEIVWRAADVIATVTQNEPKCQWFALQQGTLHLLFNILTHPDGTVRKKAVYALSALVRQNKSVQTVFLKEGGLEKIKIAMSDSNHQVQTKAVFFFYSLCLESQEIKDSSFETGIPSKLIELLSSEDETLREQVINALISIVDDHSVNSSRLLDPSLSLKQKLEERLKLANVGEEANLIRNLQAALKI